MNKEEAIRAQWDALGQQRYEFGQITQDGRTWNDIRRWENLRQKLERYTTSNEEGKENIYIRPVPADEHSIIFLDDVTVEGINFLRENGIFPACVAETSQTNFQIWIRLANHQPREIRKGIERYIIGLLEQHGYHADSGSADGMHYGRLVGFINQKPSRGGFRVALIEATGEILSDEKTTFLLQQSLATATTSLAVTNDCYPSLEDIRVNEYDQPDIVEFFGKLLPSIYPGGDRSRQDFMLCARCAKEGYSEKDICKALLELGPHDCMRKSKPSQYLYKTVRAAIAHESRKLAEQTPSTGMNP